MAAPTFQPVFLSYASQDAEAARAIAEALRAAGVEVWFDQNELVGGDAWDAKIRRQIAECALFVPVISAATQARREGYFRLEWRIAAQRTHMMSESVAFLLPVVIDATRDADADVPTEFKAVQWTRLNPVGSCGRALDAAAIAAFCVRVRGLLEGGGAAFHRSTSSDTALPSMPQPERKPRPRWRWPVLIGGVTAIAVVAVVLTLAARRISLPAVTTTERREQAASAHKPAPAPNAKAVAVLPFENLSVEPDSAFLADGIHGEVITAVGKVAALTVIGRTSVLPYADARKRNLRQIAADLSVAAVVEGRVQRVGRQVRISVELVDTQSGRQLWGHQFESELNDVFSVQALIAREVAATLKATLTASEQTLIDRRLTRSPAAYELFLRARLLEETNNSRSSLADYERAAAAYERVLAEDPSFALAHARLTYLHGTMFWLGQLDPTPARRARAESAMQSALRLDPTAPETHYARGLFAYYCEYDWARGLAHYHKAQEGLPNDAALAGLIGYAHRRLGNWSEAIQAFERAVALNPRNLYDGGELANLFAQMRRFEPAMLFARRFAAMFPEDNLIMDELARVEFALTGDRRAYLDALAKLPKDGRDPTGSQAAYERALWAHDFAAAENALSDPRLTGIVDRHGLISDPVALHRAVVAALRGQREATQRFAVEATAEFARRNWTGRQRFMVAVGQAAAKGLAGRVDEAAVELQAAAADGLKFDAYAGNFVRHEAGRYLALLGRREEALAVLGECMRGLSRLSAQEVRLDPLWSLLERDPRFEEILKGVKPL